MYNYNLVNCDTDGFSICKTDGSKFSSQEEEVLLKQLNDLYPDGIKWTFEGQFHTSIVVKAKNYILYDGKKITYKGSAIKATSKQPALKEFIKELINEMLEGNYDFISIYNKYVEEIMDIEDIKRWATKKTISSKVLAAKRTNEKVILDAIKDTEYQEGDRAYFYYKSDQTLSVVENYKKDYDKDRLLESLYKTATGTFNTVIDPKIFLNYKLKRNKEALNSLMGS